MRLRTNGKLLGLDLLFAKLVQHLKIYLFARMSFETDIAQQEYSLQLSCRR